MSWFHRDIAPGRKLSSHSFLLCWPLVSLNWYMMRAVQCVHQYQRSFKALSVQLCFIHLFFTLHGKAEKESQVKKHTPHSQSANRAVSKDRWHVDQNYQWQARRRSGSEGRKRERGAEWRKLSREGSSGWRGENRKEQITSNLATNSPGNWLEVNPSDWFFH